ncbi:MAG: hypothetical protein H7X89_14495 [Rhizobiales bacterium]|nr:hypothetical protein [Hyphomicrobiales bacterium]
MRLISSIPVLAVVIAAYNLFVFGGGGLDAQSDLFSWVLPSGTEVYFKSGDVFALAGLVALFFEILKAARAGAGTIADHMLSTAAFIVALIEFILLPACGTVAFFLLTVMALIDVVAGYTISILGARRDYSINRDVGF